MAIDYTRINWKNEPNETTPLSAENLNKMDKAIDDLATDVNSLEPNPVEVATEGLEKLAYGGTVYEVKGGHKIVNDNGVILAQKDNLKFGGVYSHNSSTMTEVDIVREFNSVSDIENLTGEEAKGFQYLDDDVYDEFTAGDIGFDNSNTSFVGTNVQDVLEEVDTKIDEMQVEKDSSQTMFTIRKQGNVVSIHLNLASLSLKSDGFTLSESIPSEYRPNETFRCFTMVYNGSSYVDAEITIVNSTGDIRIVNMFGTAISGIQANYLKNTDLTYMID